MANEISLGYTTGKTLYAAIFDPSQTKFWRQDTHVWETYAAANWTHYAEALTETGIGNYLASFPTQITDPGTYSILFYQQAGGSPAITDTVLGEGSLDWNGVAETPTVIANPATPNRRSLANYRRVLGFLPDLASLTLVVTSGTPADARSIIASDLAGGLDPNLYQNAWVMPYDGAQQGQVRRVGIGALNTATGQLATSVAFPGVIASGTTVEIHQMLPPNDRDRMTGLNRCINLALAECWIPQRLSLSGVANAPSYSLSADIDYLDPDAVYEVYGPSFDATLNPVGWPGYSAYQNAENLTLEVAPAFAANDAIQVGITRPGNTYIKVSGSWGSSTVGLVNDTDEALFTPEWLAEIALVHAFKALSSKGETAERTYWSQKANQQRLKANRMKMASLVHPTSRAAHASGYGSRGGFDGKDFGSWPW